MRPLIRPIMTLAAAIFIAAPGAMGQTPIAGRHAVEPSALAAFVQRHNPDFDPAIAYAFIDVGERYGIRGDIALCQAIIETGWFRFDKGTAVTPEMHNYCGLGVTSLGAAGCCFSSIEEGVAAMLQHLYAYCCTDPLPPGEEVLDPRFEMVTRGCATTWEDLSGRWAMNPAYGKNIMALYARVAGADAPATRVEVIEVEIPDEFL